MDLHIDSEFRDLVPPPQPEELRELEASLLKDGNRDPIVVWKETRIIVDGHHRYSMCLQHGIPMKAPVEMSFEDRTSAKEWVLRNQFGRRNLSPYHRSVVALKLGEIVMARAKARQREHGNTAPGRPRTLPPTLAEVLDTRSEMAEQADVSHGTLDKVRHIEERATTEQKQRLARGESTINGVFMELRRREARERVAKAEWPDGKYRVIYADPPWQYSNTQPDYHGVQDDHYPTMSLTDICTLPVRDLALDDAVLFLWATSPILESAFKVIHSWGFAYKASFVWDKVRHNMGHYNSVRHEFLLVAVRGSCPPDNLRLFDSVQAVERTAHSAKPEEFRKIIDTLYPHGRRIELFARSKADGWDRFGNQTP